MTPVGNRTCFNGFSLVVVPLKPVKPHSIILWQQNQTLIMGIQLSTHHREVKSFCTSNCETGSFNCNVISLTRIVNNFERMPIQALLRHQLFRRLFRTQAELEVTKVVSCYLYCDTNCLWWLNDETRFIRFRRNSGSECKFQLTEPSVYVCAMIPVP